MMLYAKTSLMFVFMALLMSACQHVTTPVTAPATRLSGSFYRAEVTLPGFEHPQTVIYEVVDGYAFFEGDIILGRVDAQGNLVKGELASQGIVKDSGRWPGGLVPFQINANVSAAGRQNITDAIAEWEAKTPINFIQRTGQSDFVEFVRGTSDRGCSSSIGRVGGRQQIKLLRTGDCSRRTLIHEMGHAVGLYHEHTREDRDKFVTILWDNIASGEKHNFEKRVSGATDIGAYDYASVMHYRADSFCKLNIIRACVGPTIETKPAGISIGLGSGLSQGDISTVLKIYPIVKHPRGVADVNGDRKADLVAFGNDGVYVSLSAGSGFTAPRRWTTGFSHNDGLWRTEKHPRLLGDINGDGKKDIVGFGDEGAYASISTGSSFTPGAFVVREFGYDQGWRLEMHPRVLADVNGDGKQDIVGFANDGVYVSLSTSTVTAPGFTGASRWLLGLGYNDFWRVERHPRFLTDIDSDGKEDIVAFGDTGVWIALSTGSGFGEASFVLAEFGYNSSGVNGGWRVDMHLRLLGDVSGDRRPDIVGFADNGVYVSLGTGNGGFAASSLWSPDFLGWQVDRHPRVLTNVDGNNGRDILGFGDAGVWVSKSTGSSFTSNTFWLADFGYDDGWRVNKNPRFLADVSGDNKPDIIGFGDDGVWAALQTTSGFSRARFVLAQYGYNDGWR